MPKSEMLTSDDPYYHGGARCHHCGYLYFPDSPGTWNQEEWIADFDRKAETILQQTYARTNDWRFDAYLALHFVNSLDAMVTWYFSSPEFSEHGRLLNVLKSLGARKSVDTLQSVIRLARRPEQVLERFGLVGETSEAVDDAWEEVTEELSQSMDTNLRKLIYDRFMRDHGVAEFVAG